MPLLKISTNVSAEKIPKEFHLHMVEIVANMLNKPLQYVACQIVANQDMSFGGTFQPCAQVLLQSIGRLGVEENKVYSAAIASELEKWLGIQPNRSYIFFHDVNVHQFKFIKVIRF